MPASSSRLLLLVSQLQLPHPREGLESPVLPLLLRPCAVRVAVRIRLRTTVVCARCVRPIRSLHLLDKSSQSHERLLDLVSGEPKVFVSLERIVDLLEAGAGHGLLCPASYRLATWSCAAASIGYSFTREVFSD